MMQLEGYLDIFNRIGDGSRRESWRFSACAVLRDIRLAGWFWEALVEPMPQKCNRNLQVSEMVLIIYITFNSRVIKMLSK